MDSIYLDGTLSISRFDYPEMVQVTAWSGSEVSLSNWVKSNVGLALPSATKAFFEDDYGVLSTGPKRWLVTGEGVADFILSFDENLGTILDLSSARTLFRLRGDNLAWLLNKGTSVDLCDGVTPDGSVVMTTIDHVGVIIHKISQDAFDLYAFSSFGDSMEHWLSTSSNDLDFQS